MAGGRHSVHVAIAASMVILVLAGGLVSATARGGLSWLPGSSVRTAGDVVDGLPAGTTAGPTPTLDPSTTLPPPLPTPTSAPSTTVTTRSATTVPRPPGGEPVVRSTRAGYGPYPPETVEIPFSPGQTEWSGVSNGITIRVRTDIARPKAGQMIRFEVELSTAGQPCCGGRILFGDGGGYDVQNVERCAKPPGGTVRFERRHAYNVDGRWTFNVSGWAGGCQGSPTTGGELFGTLEVAPGVTTAQGPFPPRVSAGSTVQPEGRENDHSWLSLVANVEDEDGWVRRIIVDWGDGTPPTVVPQHPAAQCRRHAVSGWPLPSVQTITTGSLVHQYAAPGIYTVTVVGISTGCDGTSEPQQGMATVTRQVSPSR